MAAIALWPWRRDWPSPVGLDRRGLGPRPRIVCGSASGIREPAATARDSRDGTTAALSLVIMTTLTTIDLDSLAGVVGGVKCTCSVTQDQPGGDPGAGAQPGGPTPPSAAAPGGAGGGGGGGFLSVVNAIIGFLKSPMFSHLVNGAGEFASAFGSDSGAAGAAPQGDAGTQQA
jgi:hypothetical protein